MPDELLQSLAFEASENWELKALFSLAAVFVALIVRWLTARLIKRNVDDATIRLVWIQIASGSYLLILFFVLSWIWLEGAGSILALLTLVAAAMTIVHKEIILNFSSWSVIAWRNLFKLGDHIEINSNIGKVADLGPMYFTLNEATGIDTGLRPTGRTIRVPNSMILTHAVANYSEQGVRWIDVEYAIAGSADWESALSIIEDVITTESTLAHVDPSRPTDLTVTVQVKNGQVVFTAHYPTKPGDRLSSQTEVTRQIMKRFAESDLQLV